MTIGKINKNIFFVIFLLIPFFGFSIFRINLQVFHIPISVALLLLLLILNLTYIIIFDTKIKLEKYSTRFFQLLLMLIFIMILNTYVYMFNDVDIIWAVKSIIRVIISACVFFTILYFLPRDKKYIEIYMYVMIWSSTLLVSIYLYKYLSVNSTFLAPSWDLSGGVTGSGKNSLAFYLSISLVVILWKYLDSKVLSIWLIPLSVHAVALVYAQSRSSWLVFVVSFLLVHYLFKRRIRGKSRGLLVYLSRIILLVVMSAFIVFISDGSIKEEIIGRFELLISFIFLNNQEGDGSVITRFFMLKKALTIFLENPLLGVGTNMYPFSNPGDWFGEVYGLVAHNDYMMILSEHGIIGFSIIIAMLFQIVKTMFHFNKITWIDISLFQMVFVIILQMLFMDILYFTFSYIIFGLFFLLFSVQKKSM